MWLKQTVASLKLKTSRKHLKPSSHHNNLHAFVRRWASPSDFLAEPLRESLQQGGLTWKITSNLLHDVCKLWFTLRAN